MGYTVEGNIVDVSSQEIFPGRIMVEEGRIARIERNNRRYECYIAPGFVDAHIHIESSLLPPAEFARIAAVHGTVAAIADPHEIANVLGMDGVRFMIDDSRAAAIRICWGAPSCVPATSFETSGARLGPEEVEALLRMNEVRHLAEVMNVPGVLNGDSEVLAKLESARRYSKPIDGHAPGLFGSDLERYHRAGISTDHECVTLDEARQKIAQGMKILIREGSAARNFDELAPLVEEHWEQCMFCSDDKHPNDLVDGHINLLARRAVGRGLNPLKVFAVASLNPVIHYGLDLGMLRHGDWADFVIFEDLQEFKVIRTVMRGTVVAEEGRPLQARKESVVLNNFTIRSKDCREFALAVRGSEIRVLGVIDGQLITTHEIAVPTVVEGKAVSDPGRDILKLAVVNRYHDAPAAVGFVRNIGLQKGALASSVAHDSHNIIAVGVTDEDLCKAVNTVISHKGGLCVVTPDTVAALPLPIGGLMSTEDFASTAQKYTELDSMAKSLGSTLSAPFMTLSFLSLPVIPSLKLTDRGLFDGERFNFVDVFTS